MFFARKCAVFAFVNYASNAKRIKSRLIRSEYKVKYAHICERFYLYLLLYKIFINP